MPTAIHRSPLPRLHVPQRLFSIPLPNSDFKRHWAGYATFGRIRQATGLTYGLCLLALLAGCHASKAEPPADDKSDPPPLVKVEVQPVVRTSLDETIEVLGVSAPLHSRTARLTTAIDGRVAEILPAADEKSSSPGQPAVEGQLVSRRQVIVRLDDSLARAVAAKAEGAGRGGSHRRYVNTPRIKAA